MAANSNLSELMRNEPRPNKRSESNRVRESPAILAHAISARHRLLFFFVWLASPAIQSGPVKLRSLSLLALAHFSRSFGKKQQTAITTIMKTLLPLLLPPPSPPLPAHVERVGGVRKASADVSASSRPRWAQQESSAGARKPTREPQRVLPFSPTDESSPHSRYVQLQS